VAAPAVVRAQAAMKLPLATVWPDSNFHTVNCRRFADEVKKVDRRGDRDRTSSRVASSASRGRSALRAVRDGLVPIDDYLNVQQVGDEPFLGITAIPFLAGSPDELKVLQKHIRPGTSRSRRATTRPPLCRAVAEPVPASRRSRPRPSMR
jgi:hypothetical protein